MTHLLCSFCQDFQLVPGQGILSHAAAFLGGSCGYYICICMYVHKTDRGLPLSCNKIKKQC